LLPLQPLAPAGLLAGASFTVVLFSISVLPAPGSSPLHAVAQPVTESPAPAIRLATLKPANSFFSSFLSISTSLSLVIKTTPLFYYKRIV
jgi:hypothetical protein